jgi:peptide/nickel transport system ATP-binding protein
MEPNMLLSVRNLHTWYELRQRMFGRAGYVRAVDGVTFDLAEGEAIAVVGESGCGKSSLAKTILGLYRPTRGELFFQSKPIHTASTQTLRWYRSQVGFVQQDPYGALPPFMTVRRILEEPLIIHGIRKPQRQERIHEVLEEVRLVPIGDFISKFPHMLSGGQQQRVVIARAMLLRPKLIVADEPVSMLDASVRGEILALLMRLREDLGLTLLIVTHDLGLAWSVADRVAVMYLGKIVEVGPAEDVLTNPLHPYTKALLEVAPERGGDIGSRKILTGEPPDPTRIPTGCRFHPRCPEVSSGRAAALGQEDRCRGEIPPLREIRPGHFAACHLA